MKKIVLGICVATGILAAACGGHPASNPKLLELEREVLLSPREQADSLMKEARRLRYDDVSRNLEKVLKARDYGAAEQFDSSYRALLDVATFCRMRQSDQRIYNIMSYVENTFATNILYSTSSADDGSPSTLVRHLSKELNGIASDNPSEMAATAYLKAVDYAQKAESPSRIPLIYYNLSMVYSGKAEPATAAFYCRKALFAADSIGWSVKQSAFIYLALAESYVGMRDPEHALQALKKGETVYDMLPPEDRAMLYRTYAKAYVSLGKNELASSYCRKALDEIKKSDVGADYSYYSILMQYVDCTIKLGKDLRRLSQYVNESEKFFTGVGDKDNVLYAGVLGLRIATAEHNTAEAGRRIKKLLADGIETGLATGDTQQAWYSAVDTYYRQLGALDKAYPYYQKSVALDDSIRGFAQKQYVANLGMEYRMDTLNLSHKLSEQRQQGEIRDLNWKYLTATMAGVVVALCFVGYFVYSRRRRMLQHEQYLSNMNRLKMQNIRNCISPHFTFNILNREILLSPENGEVYNRLMNLAHLLRRSLDATSQIAIPLSQELDFTQAYIKTLQECGKKFAFELHVDGTIDGKNTLIPSMIIQIPVENAVKHGFTGEPGTTAWKIDITVSDKQSGIGIDIVNNGETYSPFNAGDGKTGKGIGMQVIYQSLLMMNQKNKEKITFTISDRRGENESGTRVSVYVPYKFDYSV